MIRSSKHTLNNANKLKKEKVNLFLDEYIFAIQKYVDYIWNNPIYINNKLYLDIQKDILSKISFIDYNAIKFNTNLSARALDAASSQACSIISSVISRRSKYLYVLNLLKEKNDIDGINRIQQKLDNIKISCPIVGKNIKAELSSKLFDIQFNKNSFDCFIRLKSLGKFFGFIKIPFNLTKVDHKWNKGKLLNSILLGRNSIELRYEIPKKELKEIGITVGADTGVNSLITLSDGQIAPLTNNHGYSFSDILDDLSKKKKGSKAFKRKQEHRKNFINWSINQLNLDNIKEIRLEKIENLFYKQNTSKKLKGFTNSLIENKVKSLQEEQGVLITFVNSSYKSQRCFECGIVLKKNRKGKLYKCNNCGNIDDSDYNAAKNNSIELIEIPICIKKLGLNKKEGFIWNLNGLFDLNGQELNKSLILKKSKNLS